MHGPPSLPENPGKHRHCERLVLKGLKEVEPLVHWVHGRLAAISLNVPTSHAVHESVRRSPWPPIVAPNPTKHRQLVIKVLRSGAVEL